VTISNPTPSPLLEWALRSNEYSQHRRPSNKPADVCPPGDATNLIRPHQGQHTAEQLTIEPDAEVQHRRYIKKVIRSFGVTPVFSFFANALSNNSCQVNALW
jgi:hypothetical protein